MDKKTRLLNCIDGKPIDRPPFTFWHHYGADRAYGQASIQAHKELFDQTGIDFIKMMSDGYNDISFGVKIDTYKDWDHIKIPRMTDPFVREQVDKIKGVIDAISDTAYVYYVIFAAFTLMRMSFGRELCYQHMLDDEARPYIRRALANLGDFVAEAAALYITEGGMLGGLHCFNSNGQDHFNTEQYRAWLRPEDIKLINATNAVSDYNIAHFCGWTGVPNNMEAWNDYTASTAHWDIHTDGISLMQGKDYFPNKRAIMGGFDNKEGSILYTGTKEQVQQAVNEMVQQGGRTSYILSADCSLLPSVDYQRLIWVREALDALAN